MCVSSGPQSGFGAIQNGQNSAATTPPPAPTAVDPNVIAARQNLMMNLQMAAPTGGATAATGKT